MSEELVESLLRKDIPVLLQEIRLLYQGFDKRFGLHGADLPISFKITDKELGSYVPINFDTEEGFTFSLTYVAYSSYQALKKEDKIDLFKHEYAHYMNHHLEAPKEYLFEPGAHGSSWRYFASLIGAVPSAYYKVGEALKKQDYRLVKKEVNHEKVRMTDMERRMREERIRENTEMKIRIGEEINHPKYGKGIVEDVEQTETSVRCIVRFGDEIKKLDQNWILKSRLK